MLTTNKDKFTIIHYDFDPYVLSASAVIVRSLEIVLQVDTLDTKIDGNITMLALQTSQVYNTYRGGINTRIDEEKNKI